MLEMLERLYWRHAVDYIAFEESRTTSNLQSNLNPNIPTL
jgi:hypothetical protein